MRNVIIVLAVLICSMAAMQKKTFSAASLSDMFITPNGDISFFGGYLGGDGDWSDPNGVLDWAIGNRRVFSPVNTEDLVISTCVGDWHLSADWLERMRITKDGKVGIGTDTPGAILHIGGISGVDGIMFPDGTLQLSAQMIGPQGIPKSLRFFSQVSLHCSCMISAMIGTSCWRLCTRALLLAKRSSFANSGHLASSQNRRNCASLPTARIM